MKLPHPTLLSAAIAALMATGAIAGDVTRVEESTTTTQDATGQSTTTTTTVRFEDYDADADGVLVQTEIPATSSFAPPRHTSSDVFVAQLSRRRSRSGTRSGTSTVSARCSCR